jgi:hypothetical protein
MSLSSAYPGLTKATRWSFERRGVKLLLARLLAAVSSSENAVMCRGSWGGAD